MFSIFLKTKSKFWVTFTLLSACALNLNQSKTLSFGMCNFVPDNTHTEDRQEDRQTDTGKAICPQFFSVGADLLVHNYNHCKCLTYACLD